MATASLIELVKRQALTTFSSKVSSFPFEENLTKLKLLASKLTSADVKLDRSLMCVSERKSDWKENRLAPVTYIQVFENSDITIGIFILKAGARLPLHDHPLMYGVLKVIDGSVRICSYSPVSRVVAESGDTCDNISEQSINFPGNSVSWSDQTSKSLFKQMSLLAVKEPELLLCEKDEACVLCPRQGNIHEIHSVNGPAAFLDILAPPYESDIPGEGPRICRYFKDVTHNETSSLKTLVRIPPPRDYWSDSAPYQGPSCATEN